MRVFFLIALRNLWKHQTRLFVLGGAIALIAFLLTILLALVGGIQDTMIRNGTALMTGHVNIAGFYKISPSSASPMVMDYEKLMKLAREEVPDAQLIIDRMKAYGKVISETDTIQIPIWGVNYNQEKEIIGRLETEAGEVSGIQKRGTIVLFKSQASKLSVGVGDRITVSLPTYRNMSNTMDLQVVAILRDLGLMSQFSAFMNSDDAREVYKIKSSVSGQVMIFLKDIALVPKVEDALRRRLAKDGYTLMAKEAQPFFLKFDRVSGEAWTGQRLDVTTWEEETSFLKWILQLLSALTYGLVAVLLVVVTIGLMNALWMSIRERTFEIGTLRAMGLLRRQVFLMFMLEAGMLAFGATALGAFLGSGVALLLNAAKVPLTSEALKIFLMSNTLSFRVGASELLQVFFMMIGFLMLGALVPIWQAARMRPVTAMAS